MTVLAPGSVFAGYRLEEIAGRGGMAVVYRARQLRPDRLVAVKVIAPGFAQDPVFRSRFERESELAASIEHPNVIPVYEVDEVDGLLFIAMRFVEGADLHTLIGDGLEPAVAVGIVEQVAGALDAAHAHGLVHRDVKPANVLIADAGGRPHAYLTDFGLTQRTAASKRLTRTGAFMGTIAYAAPEQIRGDDVDARTDVYALSCVLYESLTREIPYPRDSDVAAIWAHIESEPPSVLERGLELPRRLDDVIRRGMAKNPDERFASAGDLARAALAALDDRPARLDERTVATGEAAPRVETIADDVPAPAGPRAAASGRRRILLAATAVASVVAVVTAAAIALTGGGGDDRSGAGSGLEAQWSAAVGGYPLYAATAGGKVWTALQDADRLKSLDPASRAVTDTPRLGASLSGLAAADGRLLAGDYGEDATDGRGTVVAVDPESGRPEGAPIATTDPFDIATDGRTLWVTDTERLDVIDLATGNRTRRIEAEGAPFDVALLDGTAWVADNDRGELLAYDARSGERRGRPIDVGARPLSVAAADGRVWIATDQGQLVRVSTEGLRPESLAVGGEGNRVVEADARGVWVVDEQGQVVLVDPARLAVRGRLRLSGNLQDLALDRGGAYVLRARSSAESTVVRVVPAESG
jgi:Protein kinase domain